MKIKTPLTISNLDSLEDVTRYVSITLDALFDVLNGKVGLTDNCDTRALSVSFAGANSTVQTAHNLGRIPIGYIVTGRTANLNVFDGNQANTGDHIYLQASAAGTASLLIF